MSAPTQQEYRRKALWESMLDAEMNVCFWDLLSARYSKWDTSLKIIIAVAASGTVAGWSIWSQYPGGWKVFSAIACLAALMHPYFCSSDVLKRISGLVGTWKEVFIEYELLWYDDNGFTAERTWTQFGRIKHREAAIDETRLPKSPKLVRKAFRHVLEKRGLTNG